MTSSPVLNLVGEWGIAQTVLYIFIQYIYTLYGWQSLQLVFLTPDVTVVCRNATSFYVNASEVDPCSETCSQVSFKNQDFDVTLTEKLDLSCHYSWLKSFGTTLLMASGMIMNLIGGELCDRFGRRKVVLMALVPYLLGAISILLSPNYPIFAVGIVLVGMSYAITFNFSYVLLFELCGEKQRSLMSMTMDIGFSLGAVLLGGVAWAFRHWFWIQLVNVILISLLAFCWFLPESPAWLLEQSRVEDCVREVRRIVRFNRRPNLTNQEILIALGEPTDGVAAQSNSAVMKPDVTSIKDLFLAPEFRFKMLRHVFYWFAISLIHYGFILHVKLFSDDLFTNFILSALCCLPSVALLVVLIKFLNIKWIIVVYCLITAVFSCSYGFAQDIHVYKTVTVIVGWACSSNVLVGLYLLTSEAFPTSVRGKAVGIGTFMCRVAASVAPFTKEMGEATAGYTPVLLFGVLSVLMAAILAFSDKPKGRSADNQSK